MNLFVELPAMVKRFGLLVPLIGIFFPNFSFAGQEFKVILGNGQAQVQSRMLLSEPEKLKQIELELLIDEDLADLITNSDVKVLSINLDLDSNESARKIFKALKKEVLNSSAAESEAAMEEVFSNPWLNFNQWKFEYETMQRGDWETLGFSLWKSFRSWLNETVNWILVNIFKILFCLLLGSFLYRLAPDVQKRSLVYLRRSPFFSFALGWVFLFLAGAAAVGLLLSLVGIPFFFVLWLVLFILVFLSYILVSQLFLYFLSRILPFLWFDSTVLRLLSGLLLITTLEYYVPYFEYVVAFLVMAGFGAQIKELISASPRASVR